MPYNHLVIAEEMNDVPRCWYWIWNKWIKCLASKCELAICLLERMSVTVSCDDKKPQNATYPRWSFSWSAVSFLATIVHPCVCFMINNHWNNTELQHGHKLLLLFFYRWILPVHHLFLHYKRINSWSLFYVFLLLTCLYFELNVISIYAMTVASLLLQEISPRVRVEVVIVDKE